MILHLWITFVIIECKSNMNKKVEMQMKWILCSLIMLSLCSCSIAKVHLYTRYLSEAEIKKISTKLEKENFKVIPNTLLFPEKIQQSTLLYSPFIQSVDKVDKVVNSLSQLGWPAPNVESLVTSNHKYTKDNTFTSVLHQCNSRCVTTIAR